MRIIKTLIIIITLIILVLLMSLTILKKQPEEKVEPSFSSNIVIHENILNNKNVLSNQNLKDRDNEIIEQTTEESFEQDENIGKITNVNYINEYYTIQMLVNNYIINVKDKNIENLKAILSRHYINKYDINDNNILEELKIPELLQEDQYYKTIITEILTANLGEQRKIYIIKQKCRIVNDSEKFDMILMIEVDNFNRSYCIYPEQYVNDIKFNNLKDGDIINYTKSDIQQSDKNVYTEVRKTNVDLIKEYFSNLKELLLYYPEVAFNKLDKKYSDIRFNNKENFYRYLEENKSLISLMNISKYKIISTNAYIDYICTDQYDRIYMFRQQGGILDYSVFLDNYTVITEDELNYYNDFNEFYKAKYNLTKFINMVNTKDYNAIYNVLDTTFRDNNFKNIESLKNYIQQNMYTLNYIEIEDFTDNSYYGFECKLGNRLNESESKNITVIIKQNEDSSFKMSFSLK